MKEEKPKSINLLQKIYEDIYKVGAEQERKEIKEEVRRREKIIRKCTNKDLLADELADLKFWIENREIEK